MPEKVDRDAQDDPGAASKESEAMALEHHLVEPGIHVRRNTHPN